MSAYTDDDVTAALQLARVLRKQGHHVTNGDAQAVYAAVAPAIAARALRQAADDLEAAGGDYYSAQTEAWLRARADQIGATDE